MTTLWIGLGLSLLDYNTWAPGPVSVGGGSYVPTYYFIGF